jgi:hypothetical protein
MTPPRNPTRAWEVAIAFAAIALVAFGFALADLAEQVLR